MTTATNNQHRKYNLLERYIFESNIEANIFSKNIESVKKAIEEGEDVNSVDRFGRTPLVALCVSKTPDVNIAKLLLDNGADSNAHSAKKDTQCLTLAIINSQNIDLINLLIDYKANINPQEAITPIYNALDKGVNDADCLFSLIPNVILAMSYKIRKLFNEIIKSYSIHMISESTASKLVSMIIESTEINVLFYSVDSEFFFKDKSLIIVHSFLDKDIWPFGESVISRDCLDKLSKSDKTYIAEFIKRILKTDLSTVCSVYSIINDCICLCNLCPDLIKLSDFINQSNITTIVNNITHDNLKFLILSAIRNNNSDFIRLIISACKGKLKTSDIDKIFETAAIQNISDDVARQIIRLVRLCYKEDEILISNSILNTENKVLHDFILDQGYKNNSSRVRAERGNKEEMLRYGISYITDDDSPNVINLFNMYPELVNSEEFYKEAVKLSSDSFNARQAVRYIDSHKPKKSDDEFSGYDM